jgi:hypothetical protein
MGLSAGSYEVTPSNRWVSSECPGQADGSYAGQSKRTSAGFLESDLARALTQTLNGSPTQVVDPQRPLPILAAGSATLISLLISSVASAEQAR